MEDKRAKDVEREGRKPNWLSTIRKWTKSRRMLYICFSRSSDITERREMGQWSEGEEDGGEDLGIGGVLPGVPEEIDWLGRELMMNLNLKRYESPN